MKNPLGRLRQSINRFTISGAIFVGIIASVLVNADTPEITSSPYYPPDYTHNQVDVHAKKFAENERTKQLSCLSTAIYAEARNQSQFGQRMVAETILQRVDNKRWPNTICRVVYQSKQFSFVNDINAHKAYEAFTDNKHSKEVLTAIKIAVDALARPVEERIAGTHYHTTSIKPSWSKNMKTAAIVEDHIFYE